MIRYDVLWNNLRDSVNNLYANSAASMNYWKKDTEAWRINQEINTQCARILAQNGKMYREMIELDKKQQNENLTLLEILQELKKLNKGKEEEEDGPLDNHGDGFGDDAGDQGNAERDQSAQTESKH